MTLDKSQDLWNELADVDPMWAVLSWTDKRHGTWDLNQFRLTGEAEMDAVLEICRQLDRPGGHDHSLDFGLRSNAYPPNLCRGTRAVRRGC